MHVERYIVIRAPHECTNDTRGTRGYVKRHAVDMHGGEAIRPYGNTMPSVDGQIKNKIVIAGKTRVCVNE